MRAVVYLVAVVLGVVAVLVVLWPVARHRLIYPGGTLAPDRSHPSAHGLPHGEEVWLDTNDGIRIHAWWVPARGGRSAGPVGRAPQSGGEEGSGAGQGFDASAGPDPSVRGAVVYCHGNAETMATRAWIADRLSRLGYHTLLFDYRGYGLSEGRASEEGLARDARAAWRHVVEVRAVKPDRVVLMGHSLGSAVATRLALELESGHLAGGASDGARAETTPPAALVVGSPFPSMPELFAHHAPWLPDRALHWRTDRLDAGSRLNEVRIPKLVIIGTNDDVVPPAMSRAVYDGAARGTDAEATAGAAGIGADPAGSGAPTLVTVPADHATMMGHPAVWTALDRFLAGALDAGE